MARRALILLIAALCAAAPAAAAGGSAFEPGVRRRADQRRAELIRLLNAEGFTYETRPLLQTQGAWGSSVFVRSHIGAPQMPETVIAVPLTTLNDTGERPHAGFEAALAFLRERRNDAGAPPALAAFLADEWDVGAGVPAYAGLSDLLDAAGQNGAVILYFDCIEAPSRLGITQAAANAVVPLEIVQAFTTACAAAGVPFSFATKFNALYKYHFAGETPVIRRAGEYEIPLLYVQSLRGGARTIQSAAAAKALEAWAHGIQPPAAAREQGSTHYYIAGLNFAPVYFSERAIIVYAFLFVILFFICSLLTRYARSRTRIYFFVLIIFFALFFMSMAFFDITLMPIAMPSLFILSLLFFLQAINKKWRVITKHIPVVAPFVILICIAISLVPFISIISDGIKFDAAAKASALYTIAKDELPFAGDERFYCALRPREFLDRRVVILDCAAQGEPVLYRITLKPPLNAGETPETHAIPPFIYVAPSPWRALAEGLELTLGAFPPAHTALEIVLPREVRGGFEVEALWAGDRLVRRLSL